MKRTSRNTRRLDRVRRSPSIYSRTEAQREVKRSLNSLFYLLILILIGGVIYLVLFSPYLKVKSISISDLKYYEKSNIEKIVTKHQENILNKNILTFSASSLERKIGDSDGIKSVKVSKKYSSQNIVIDLEEKRPVFVWETVGKKYLVDENGYLTANFEEKFEDLSVVFDTKNLPVELQAQIGTASFSRFIDELSRDFNTYTSTAITKIEVPEITSEIKVTTAAGWYALFDTTRTAKGQLVNLSRIISETNGKKRLEYVDLRIDNRIFYK